VFPRKPFQAREVSEGLFFAKKSRLAIFLAGMQTNETLPLIVRTLPMAQDRDEKVTVDDGTGADSKLRLIEAEVEADGKPPMKSRFAASLNDLADALDREVAALLAL